MPKRILSRLRAHWHRLMAFRERCHEEAEHMNIDQSGRYPGIAPGEWLD